MDHKLYKQIRQFINELSQAREVDPVWLKNKSREIMYSIDSYEESFKNEKSDNDGGFGLSNY
jgi:hypothetical protein